MANRKTDQSLTKDDVQIIRQILFGESLDALNARMERLEAAVGDLREALEEETKARISQRDEETGRLERIKQEMAADLERTIGRITTEAEKKAESQRKSLDRMNRKIDRIIRGIKKDMSGHESQLENLVGSLASALSGYRSAGDMQDDEAR